MHWWIWALIFVPLVVVVIGVAMVQHPLVPTPSTTGGSNMVRCTRTQDFVGGVIWGLTHPRVADLDTCLLLEDLGGHIEMEAARRANAHGIGYSQWKAYLTSEEKKLLLRISATLKASKYTRATWFSVEAPDSNDADLPAPDYGKKIMP